MTAFAETQHDSGRTFVLLGAGFSRAANDAMPTLSRLTEGVVEKMPGETDELSMFNDDLEQWLSYLAVDQPWLTEDRNLENRARFVRASQAVHDVITEAETAAANGPFQMWLQRLVSWLYDEAVNVATFNYDLLLERAAFDLGLLGSWEHAYVIPLSRREGSTIYPSPPEGPQARVYKLHGSINWAYPGMSAPVSERITLTTAKRLGWGRETRNQNQRRGDEPRYDDLMPMIVPPTLTKSVYYSNTSLRAQWRSTAEALSRAENLVVIGYSLPPSDVNARQFISTLFKGSRVTVVDPCKKVKKRYVRLLEARKTEIVHVPNVEEFVDSTCGDLVEWGLKAGEDSYPHPYINYNGSNELADSRWTVDPDAPGDPAERLLTETRDEVERRWPRLTQRGRRDIRASTISWNADAQLAYLPPRAAN
ncbi:SIR2 family protein [Phytoactinopolyspora halotolerans]|uniref:Uncharacterized protein n=1 Tax=Phytoactinopolyspora halotolerans TaxID=1981512 RepID=A0A6L9S7K8_9ACTN|nr:SIR2 family protein [Phytoactinopolyspora halotolerans]NEE01146.1 hypothetical protein [Phytoactinopolyspora halotolerans]